MTKSEKLMALDYGTARIGLALSVGAYSLPGHFLKNSPNVFANLREICRREGIEKIVLGLPEEPARSEVLRFKAKLEEEVALPIELWDEVFTTKLAEEVLMGQSKKKKKSTVDSLSAAFILQEYLDHNR